MRILKLIFSLCLIVYIIFFSACKKEKEASPTPETGIPKNTQEKDTQLLNDFFSTNQPKKQRFDISSENISTITGAEGTEVTISGNTLINKEGTVVSGPVTFELTEVFTKSDMILSGTPTVTTDGQLLVSGGVIKLNAMQGADTLRLSQNISVSVPTNSFDPKMSLFTGGTNGDGTFTWDLMDSSFFYQAINQYLFETDTLTWINIDKIPGNNSATTTLTINIPQDFHALSTRTFIVFDDYASVFEAYFNNSNQYENDRFPLNMKITLVGFSFKDENLYYFKDSYEVSDNLIINPIPEQISEEEAILLLESF